MQAENEILKRARNAKKSHFYTKKRHLWAFFNISFSSLHNPIYNESFNFKS